MKSIIMPPVKSTIWIVSRNISNRCSYSKEHLLIRIIALTISDEEIEYLIKIVQPIKDLGLLVKGINNFSQ